ncbi:B12-binding domain-containing radical SAM protein, partial [Chloroflexota bacterium]
DEIKYQRGNYVFFTDDNIAVNQNRAKELFLALKPLGIHWFGQFDTTVINNPEIIKLAGESGCRSAFLGVESLNKENLVAVQKKHNVNVQISELFKLFKQANINIMCSVIFGMDYDSPESIRETVDFMNDNRVEMLVPWILTPFPMTPLHEELKNDNRILHDNYSIYDCIHCVFSPSQMKPDELEDAYWNAYRHFYNLRAIIRRSSSSRNLKYNLNIFLRELYFRNSVYHRRHPIFS